MPKPGKPELATMKLLAEDEPTTNCAAALPPVGFTENVAQGVVVPMPTLPANVDVAVDVARSVPTVSWEPVAMSVVPAPSEVMMELAAKEVALVPPLETARVPVMVARVVVACQVGTPLTRARTWPSVPAEVVASLWVPLPKTTALAWILPQPVPPTLTAKVEEADQTPERMVATPVNAEESIPVPPWEAETVPVRDANVRHVVPIA